MANATTTITVDNYPIGIDNSQRTIFVIGTIAISASPTTYVTGGLALTWANATDSTGHSFFGDLVKAGPQSLIPALVWLTSAATAGTTVGGFGYVWNKAANTIQLLASAGTQTAGTGTISQ